MNFPLGTDAEAASASPTKRQLNSVQFSERSKQSVAAPATHCLSPFITNRAKVVLTNWLTAQENIQDKTLLVRSIQGPGTSLISLCSLGWLRIHHVDQPKPQRFICLCLPSA